MKTKEIYERPESEVLEIHPEGVMAYSNGGSEIGFSDEEINTSARSKRLWND